MFRQLPGQHQPHRRLNLPRSNRRLLIIPREPRTLLRKLLENIVNKRVHNPHRLARDPDIRMNLLQNLKDVNLVRLHALLVPLLFLIGGPRPGLLRKLLPGLWFLLRRRSFNWLLFSRFLLCLWRHFLKNWVLVFE
ncbi:hypothetical protein SSX86_023466 [Deinandra increscens subsp. villosa]|uniref:Uncharacterized protein n=1 Tax=Deinandra increscens subsp. villosa TaxID=3103831 RepID=A0AAP0CKU1_9ASTR